MIKVTKIAVLTSGGDSPGMNTALRAVVRTCAYNKIDCVGISRGYQGLINDDIRPLNTRSVRGIINRGGTFLYSARSNDFKTKEGRVRAYKNLIKHKVFDRLMKKCGRKICKILYINEVCYRLCPSTARSSRSG